MKNLLKKLGFHKMDEMEQHIAYKAQRNALFFLMIALFIWSIYESADVYLSHTALNPIPCFLLVVASLVQIISQSVMTRNAEKDDEDSFETLPLLKLIIGVCALAGMIATIVAAFVMMGVRL